VSLGSHQRTVGRSQTHITPKWIIDALGPFDLDPVWQHASGILCLADRIKFCRANGTEQPANSGAPACLVAFGAKDLARLRASGIEGHLVTQWEFNRAAAGITRRRGVSKMSDNVTDFAAAKRKSKQDKIIVEIKESFLSPSSWRGWRRCRVCDGFADVNSKAVASITDERYWHHDWIVCESCLESGDVEERLREHIEQAALQVSFYIETIETLESLRGRLALPSYAEWQAANEKYTERQKHEDEEDGAERAGNYADILCQMSAKTYGLIRLIKLEQSGIRDGDGSWHGSDVIGGMLDEIIDLHQQLMDALKKEAPGK
jgi:hypothetical protein